MSIQAMKQALEALHRVSEYGNVLLYRRNEQNPHEQITETITALRAAITEAERQEPVAEIRIDMGLVRLPAGYDLPSGTKLYTTPQPAPAGMVLVPVEPTEEEIDAPRYLFQALELGIKNIQDIRKHLERCGVDISCTPEWFRNDSGHLTKAGKAIVMRSLMLAAAPNPENSHD